MMLQPLVGDGSKRLWASTVGTGFDFANLVAGNLTSGFD
jgi:hypothetical protein